MLGENEKRILKKRLEKEKHWTNGIFRIKMAETADIPGVLNLIREFANYEDLRKHLEVTDEKLKDVMFSENSFVKGLVAFDDQTPIGYALFYPAFLSFKGQRSIYLEDIFITKKYRKHGIGKKLLNEVAKYGKEIGAVRMDFQVLDWNLPAKHFYKKHGAITDNEERHFKFVDKEFEKLSR